MQSLHQQDSPQQRSGLAHFMTGVILLQDDRLSAPFRLQLPCPADVEAGQVAALCEGSSNEAAIVFTPDRCV